MTKRYEIPSYPLVVKMADALKKTKGLSFAEQIACVAALEMVLDSRQTTFGPGPKRPPSVDEHYHFHWDQEIAAKYGTEALTVLTEQPDRYKDLD